MGRLKKRRGLEGGEGRRGKVVVHSSVCVLQPCVEGQEKKKVGGGRDRGVEREGERCVCVCGGGGELKTVPLCWQVLDDSSDIKVFSLTGELLS